MELRVAFVAFVAILSFDVYALLMSWGGLL